MNDMVSVIVPKSDQWNFDDFQAGPMTFKVKSVSVKTGSEQPVNISLEGTDKFYRPCKSMARVLVAAWGADSSKYVGRSLTLYGDPKVKWGGMEVGGIRISHMSHIDSALTMALTVTRANKKPYTVKPLAEQAPEKDWTDDILGATSLDELAAVWKRIPSALKSKYEVNKDERKKQLSTPVNDHADFIEALDSDPKNVL